MKKTLSIILSIILLTGTVFGLDFSAYAVVYSGECGENVYFRFDTKTGNMTIDGNGYMRNDNSSSYDGTSPFYYQYEIGYNDINSVIIQPGIEGLSNYAFTNCSGIKSVILPSSLLGLGRASFLGCTGLTNVVLPNNLIGISEYSFTGCTGLTSITIPKSVELIGSYAFDSCDSLTDVYYTGSESDWESIEIGNNNDCLNNANIHYNATPECDHTYDYDVVLRTCSSQGYITCTCNKCGFSYDCLYTDPSEHSFDYEITDATETTCGYMTFTCSVCGYSYRSLYRAPSSHDSSYLMCGENMAFCLDKTSREVVVTGSGYMHNYDYYYEDLSPVSNKSEFNAIDIWDGVESIGRYAFMNCTGVTEVNIPDSVEVIGSAAFFGCSGLTSIILPNGIKKINDHTFTGCTGLTSVTIPKSVTYIDDDAFSYCSNLTDVYYGGSENDWNKIYIGDYGNGNDCLTNATIHYNCNKATEDSVSISTGDKVNVNFYINTENVSAIRYDFNGSTTVPASELTANDDGQYEFSFAVAPAQINDTVKIEVLDNNEDVIKTYTTTVAEYCNQIIDGNFNDDTKNLAKAVLDYGKAASSFFDYNTNLFASKDYYNAEPFDFDKNALVATATGIEVSRVRYVATSTPDLRFVVNLTETEASKLTASTDKGYSASFVKVSDSVILQVKDIPAAKFDEAITITISDGKQIVYTPLAYAYKASLSDNDDLARLGNAIAYYWLAANTLFN